MPPACGLRRLPQRCAPRPHIRTSYTDTAVTPGTTYDYAVRARDTAGNVSALSATVTVTAATVVTKTLLAEAHARVAESAPGSNYGPGYLRVDRGSGVHVESVLRFTVPPDSTS